MVMRFSLVHRLLVFTSGLFALGAEAHLMPREHGTIHIVEDKAYVVLSLPVSVFVDVEACRDGTLTLRELGENRPLLEESVRTGVGFSADSAASIVEVLLNLPTGAGHVADAAEELLVMLVVGFAKPPVAFTFRSDLWGSKFGSLTLEVTASGDENTVGRARAVLSSNARNFRFVVAPRVFFVESLWQGARHVLGGTAHGFAWVLFLGLANFRRRWRFRLLLLASHFLVGAALTASGRFFLSPYAALATACSLAPICAAALGWGRPLRGWLEGSLGAIIGGLHGAAFATSASAGCPVSSVYLLASVGGALLAMCATTAGGVWLGARLAPPPRAAIWGLAMVGVIGSTLHCSARPASGDPEVGCAFHAAPARQSWPAPAP